MLTSFPVADLSALNLPEGAWNSAECTLQALVLWVLVCTRELFNPQLIPFGRLLVFVRPLFSDFGVRMPNGD